MASGRSEAPQGVEEQPRKRRLPGVDLRPGAVRQARLESGLSLAQLGKGHVTAPAIYLVETGRTRPSLPTLEHIARKTGKPVEFFLAEPAGGLDDAAATLLELEALVARGDHREAITVAQSLLEGRPAAFRLGRVRFLLAQACLGAGEPERAAALLEEARAHFETVGDAVLLAECLGVQASVASLTQPREAAALAERALMICRGMNPVPAPTEARLLVILADALVACEEWDRAAATYEAAIEIGKPAFDLRSAARLHADLGLAFRNAGATRVAMRFLARSLGIFETLRDRAAFARAETNLALVLMQKQDYAQARGHLERALELSHEADLGAARVKVLLGQCELAMHGGDVDRAHSLALEALALADGIEDAATTAEAHISLGRIADVRGDHAGADREFEMAIRGFEGMGKRERLLQTHGTYAAILERRGDLTRAYAHMKEALQASRPGLLRNEQDEERVSSA